MVMIGGRKAPVKERNCPMLSVFLYAFNAIAPILLLILLGYLLQVKQVFTIDFFKKMNTFAFRYCFPAMMFINLYQLDSFREIDVGLAGSIVLSNAALTLLGGLIAHLITRERARQGVLIQASFRANFIIIGLPIAGGLAGAEGIAVTTSMQAPTVIYFNVVAVLVLSLYTEDDGTAHMKNMLRRLLHNPILQGIVVGLAVLAAREFVPVTAAGELAFSISRDLSWLYTLLDYLSRIATPLSLIALGGRFKFSDVPGVRKELITGVAARLLMAPAVGFGVAFAFQRMGWIAMTPAVLSTLIAAFGSPVAVSSATMAAEMGADDKLASQIVVWTSLLSMGTIFLMAVLFRSIGML